MSTNSAEASLPSANRNSSILWIFGFLLLGVLVSLLGSLVITWQYHIDVEPQLIGLHFLALNAGYILSTALSQRYLRYSGIRTLALASTALAAVSLLSLAFLAPPAAVPWRMLGLGMVGISSGGLATALFYALEQRFSSAPAATANLAGVLFGSGCLLSTLVVALTYYTGSLGLPALILAAVPCVFLVLFLRGRHVPAAPLRTPEQDALRDTVKDLRSIAAVLFTLLLFFQFGNEWALAGWLPLFLIHRLGSNPVARVGRDIVP